MTGPWHIAFTDQAHPRGLARWLRLGYRHCLAYRVLENDRWLIVNPVASRLIVGVWEVPPDYAPVVTATRGPCEPPALSEPLPTHRQTWSPFRCVAVCKHLLGIRAPWVWTPWQLARYLERQR